MAAFRDYEHVTVSDTGLERRVIRFSAWDFCVRVENDRYETRPTKRHGWRVQKQWVRQYGHRHQDPTMPIPQEAKDAALERIRSQIRFAVD
jgi:hypothetical protein